MAEHKNTAIQIGQLNLRIPGSNAEMAHRITDRVGESLAQRIPASMQHHIGALSIRVHVPTGASEAEMSVAIAGAIRNALQQGHPL